MGRVAEKSRGKVEEMAAAAPTRKELLLQLGNLAAADASHDFGGDTKAPFNFNSFFKINFSIF